MLDPLPRYRTGHRDLDQAIAELVDSVDEADRELVYEMVVSAIRMGREDVDRGDMKLVSAALKELRYSFHVFRPYADIRKCTIFGSARIRSGDPAYSSARDFAGRIADNGWMVITGAGPGIMEAGHLGAGADNSFGVNIMLPFEAAANPVIADDPKLINFRYFFTRKLMFMKESHGFALLPGGFGTLDETFELLTLIQTGKSAPAPIVLLDPPGGTYWARWHEFVELELTGGGLIGPDDLCLVKVTDSVHEAVAEVCEFYRTYHSIRFVGPRLVMRLKRELLDDELATLNSEFGDLLEQGAIERTGPAEAEIRDGDELEHPRIGFRFDRHRWARLRRLIDAVNSFPAP
ncbi:MAG: LOG family protein [Acidimicrobiales bacterium]